MHQGASTPKLASMRSRLLLHVLIVVLASCARPVSAEAPKARETARPAPVRHVYKAKADAIIAEALAGSGAWDKLEHLTDRIGPRLGGSQALNQAIAWAEKAMKADELENVHREPVMVPHWDRGREHAEVVAPIQRELRLLALGGSIGTPESGLSGEVAIVATFDELHALGDSVKGKIVLYNNPMPAFGPEGSKYGETVVFRMEGAIAAAKQGASAVLIRSVTARSLRSPHTGVMRYEDGVPKIPAAALSTEDADLLARLAQRDRVMVHIELGARTLPDAPSANVIAEWRGRDRPHEVVLIGAHIDSWDVGQGAHDDGGGCAMVMEAAAILKRLDLRPARTIRIVLFTNEENGLRGGKAYQEAHARELVDHVAAIETDSGAFAPVGFAVQGNDMALAQMAELGALLAPLGANRMQAGFAGVDISVLEDAGVPLLGLEVDGSKYFDYHHSAADTLDKVDPRELRMGVAAIAVTAYVLADMPVRLGKP